MSDFFTIKLAGKNIGIAAINGYVREYCRDYLTEDKQDFEITISQSDIEYERERSSAEDKKEGIPVRSYNDSYLETLAVYRKIADKMLDYDTILFHGSAIAVDGVGYLFTAKSGTGKSTHTRLWREVLGERAVMINDDKPLISVSESGIIIYGTPWNGKHRLSTNIGVPLKAVCILERAAENHIVPITKKDAYPMLIQQGNRPSAPPKLIKTLQLIDRLAGNVKLYRLGCNMSPQAAEIAYRTMSEDSLYITTSNEIGSDDE
ncbi:MAG: hypothetical protein ACI3XF_06595 [Eubacteriales bacterium]